MFYCKGDKVHTVYRNSEELHYNRRNSKGNKSSPYIRTSKEVLSKTKNLLKEGNTCKEAYDKVNALHGGVYESSSQSNELRSLKQVYQQKEDMKPKTKSTDSYELVALIRYQRENINFLRSEVCLDQSYHGFIALLTPLSTYVKIGCQTHVPKIQG